MNLSNINSQLHSKGIKEKPSKTNHNQAKIILRKIER